MIKSSSFCILVLLATLVRGLEFDFELPHRTTKCFQETLPEGVLVKVELKSAAAESIFSVQLLGEDGNVLQNLEGSNSYRLSWTPFESTTYTLCLKNIYPQNMFINVAFLTGGEAKDYTQIAQKKDFKQVELELRKIDDSIEGIRKIQKMIIATEEDNIKGVDRLSNFIIIVSLVTAGAIIVSSCFQMRTMKGFFKKKKLI